MKKMFTLAMMMVITFSANAMNYKTAKNEALFLSDKMAYELKLTNAQYDAVYEINLDYLMGVNGRNDAYGSGWNRRNTDLKYVLTAYQYEKYLKLSYFYRPLTWNNGSWRYNVYSHYSDRNHFYKDRPNNYASYKGGHNGKTGTWRDTNKNTSHNDRVTGHGTNGNHNNGLTAHNNNGNHSKGSGHFDNRK